MIMWVQNSLFFVVLVALVGSAYFSFKSRRGNDAAERGLNAAKMNVFMGILLIAIAFIQMFLYPGSTIRMGFGLICLLLGAFNLFSGIRNHAYFRRT